MKNLNQKSQKLVAKPDIPEGNIEGSINLWSVDLDKIETCLTQSSVAYEGNYQYTDNHFIYCLLKKNAHTEKWIFKMYNIKPGYFNRLRFEIHQKDNETLENMIERSAQVSKFEIILNLGG